MADYVANIIVGGWGVLQFVCALNKQGFVGRSLMSASTGKSCNARVHSNFFHAFFLSLFGFPWWPGLAWSGPFVYNCMCFLSSLLGEKEIPFTLKDRFMGIELLDC